MRRAIVWIVFCMILLAACEKREHSNPFDPSNPDTGGVPPLLDARAGNGEVSLVWDLEPFEGISRLRIIRREGSGEPELITPSGLPLTPQFFKDTGSTNGTLYSYRLDLVLLNGAVQATAWDEATPGAAVPWFADSDGGGLGRMSPDGRDLLGRIGEGGWYLDIVADTIASSFWAAEYLGGSLEQYRSDGTPVMRMAVSGARAVTLEPGRASIWVGSFSEGTLQRWLRNGDLAWTDFSAGPIEALMVTAPGEVWAATANGELRLYRDDVLVSTIGDLLRPVALATSGGNRLFVLDAQAREVVVLDYAGFPMGRTGAIFTSPTDIDADGAGGMWVADAGRGGLVHLSGDLQEIGSVVPASGVLGVTWDGRERKLWAAGEGRLRQFDPGGALQSDLPVGGRPIKVALLHGRSPQ